MQKALDDITILDLSRVLSAPYGAMLLGDLGANIIKIENPKGGDDTRAWGPMVNGTSAYYPTINRNKRGITLNLKSPEGKEMFLKLVEKADVVVENFRPDVMKRLGLGYEVLSARNKKIVYASISGFGSYGPYADRAGYDIVAQGFGSAMALTGEEGGAPVRMGISLADISSGIHMAMGILAALHAREKTGRGQQLEVALVDTVASMTMLENMRYTITGKLPVRLGNRYALLAPYGGFHGKDKDFIIACGNDKLYQIFCCDVMKRPELAEDERFLTSPDRSKNFEQLKPLVEEWSKKHTAAEALDILYKAGIPCAPINDTADIINDPHIAGAREMFPKINQPGIGEMTVTAGPVKYFDTKAEITRPAPLLGEHNAEVFAEMLGLNEKEVADLHEKGVI